MKKSGLMTKRVFLDFDGTLIDSSRRLYDLFRELAPESAFSYEDYWRIKRNAVSQRDLLREYLHYTDEQILSFKQKWKEAVEAPERLETDAPFEGVSAFLQDLAQRRTLYLVTARQDPDRAKAQVQKWGWEQYFTNIFVTQQSQSKAAFVRAHLSTCDTDFFVGDTGDDILAGKELGMKTVGVSSGFLNADVLKKYNPDLILDRVVELDESYSL